MAAESALVERDLGGYDCVFLCDVAQFTASEARVLDAYLGRGGNLVFFLGGQVQAERYNRELGGGPGRPRILPAQLGPVINNPHETSLDPLGYRHPIVHSFEGNDKAGLLTTPVAKYYRLEIPKNSTARAVLAAGHDPLIVEQSIHKGRVVLVATSAGLGSSADQSWNYFPLWPSFVPLVQEILNWCAGGQIRTAQLPGGRRAGRRGAGHGRRRLATAGAEPTARRRPAARLEKQGRQIALRAEGD